MQEEDFRKLQTQMQDEDFQFLKEHTKEGVTRCAGNFMTPDEKTEWHCKNCGAEIAGFRIAFSIHDGYSLFGSCSGSGSCHYVIRPYCPKCNPKVEDKVPSLGYDFHGGCIDC